MNNAVRTSTRHLKLVQLHTGDTSLCSTLTTRYAARTVRDKHEVWAAMMAKQSICLQVNTRIV